ncbi:MAG: hypothetical protein EOM80_03305 [Erysipelotrichia bacterium]|nr:hypothetical protein [Erysipelotrichia bacterium]
METVQMRVASHNNIPVFSFIGHCKPEGLAELSPKLSAFAVSGIKKFVFDFSACKLINSPAMGELLDAILLIDRDFEGHIVVCGLDSLKETLFTVSGILQIVQATPDIPEALKLLENIEE